MAPDLNRRLLELLLRRNLLQAGKAVPPEVSEESRLSKEVVQLFLLRRRIELRQRALRRAERVARARAAIPRRARRRFGVRPIFQARQRGGAYHVLYPLLREDPEKFYNYFRMPVAMFDYLLGLVAPLIETTAHNGIRAEQQLALTLRFLASGDSIASLQYQYLISPAAICQITIRTCAAIWNVLKGEVFEEFSPEMWERVAKDFKDLWQFPNCCGAMDGKLNVIVAFAHTGAAYFNYHDQHSMVLFALADATYKFLMVDVGARGRRHDCNIFLKSNFGKRMANGSLGLPQPAAVEGSDGELPFVFIGDGAFPLRPDLMKPHPGEFLPIEDQVFNNRLSRPRRIVENAFGVMSAMFRILRRPIQAEKPETVQMIILACCALHNLHCEQNRERYLGHGMVDHVEEGGNVIPGFWRNNAHLGQGAIRPAVEMMIEIADDQDLMEQGEQVRRRFTEYFVDNPLPWQWEKIHIP